jgi:hypothetical protein
VVGESIDAGKGERINYQQSSAEERFMIARLHVMQKERDYDAAYDGGNQ